MTSHLELIATKTITLPGIVQSLPGCRPYFSGQYREVIENVGATLSILKARKFAQVAVAFSDEEMRRRQFMDYMQTEHLGDVFIEKMLLMHAGHPAESLLRRHANDEKRHGVIFGELAGTSACQQEGSEAYELEMRYHEAYSRWVGNDFFSLACLLHGFELRSAVLQCHWFTLMDMFPECETALLRPAFSQISTDEVFHITYTGRLVAEELSRGAPPERLSAALRVAEADIDQIA